MNSKFYLIKDRWEQLEFLKKHVYKCIKPTKFNKIGEYISGHQISVDSNDKITYFIHGKGRGSFNIKHWTEEPAESFGSNLGSSVRACFDKYGYQAACYVLTGYGPMDCCSFRVRELASRGYPSDEDCSLFKSTFKTEVRDFSTSILSIFGVFSFDIIEFERYLTKTFGYDPESNQSMSDFVTEKFSEPSKNLIKRLMGSAK